MTLLLLLAGTGEPAERGGLLEALDARLIFEISASSPWADDQDWHDLSLFIRDDAPVHWIRGRSYERDRIQAGSLTLNLDATIENGALDPRNTSSPHADCLKPRRRCRLLLQYAEVTYPIFDGYSRGVPRRHRRPNTVAVIPFAAHDGSRILSNADYTSGTFRLGHPIYGRLGTRLGGGTFADQLSGARIDSVLNAARWPSALRDVAEGRILVAGTEEEAVGLRTIEEAVDAEGGEFYFGREGEAVFRDRLAKYIEARSTTPQATFSPDTADPPYYDEPLDIEFDDTRLINDARYTGSSGVPQIVQDTESIDEYGIAQDSRTVICVSDGATRGLAELAVADNAEPQDRFESLVISAHSHKDEAIPAALGRELFDQIEFEYRPAHGGDPETIAGVIQGLDGTLTKASLTLTFKLGPYRARQFFTLGHPTLGQLGGPGVLAP